MTLRRDSASVRLQVQQLEAREVPTAGVWEQESFEGLSTGSLPSNWQQWPDTATKSFGVATAVAFDGSKVLRTAGTSITTARAWRDEAVPPDFGASVVVFANSLQPIQLFARGRDLGTAKPTYYAVELTRGLDVQLLRVVDGVSTVLGSIKSRDYVSGRWIRLTLQPVGDRLSVEVFRTDTNKYLNADRRWQDEPANAIEATDGAITGSGRVGVARPARYAGTMMVDDFRVLGSAMNDNFDTGPVGPPGTQWARWSNNAAAAFTVSAANPLSPPHALSSTATVSTSAARAWLASSQMADARVTASILANSLVPVRLIARGSDLEGNTPTYYALSVTRGLDVRLLRVVNGVATELGSIKSNAYFSNQWVRVSLLTIDNRIQAIVSRADTGQYLDDSGNWRNALTRAIDVQDDGIPGAGFVGVERASQFAGTVVLDDFEAAPAGGDTTPPTVTITAPANGERLTGVVTVKANAVDNGPIERVEFFVDGVLRFVSNLAPYEWRLDTSSLQNGPHDITVRAFDLEGNAGSASLSITTENDVLPRPSIPRHYSHIRVAALAYHGNPMTDFEKNLLRNSIDLVVPNPIYLSTIDQVAPNTPQLIYSNISNLYEQLLLDWLNYADARGIDRELAFYHAASPAAWSHDSPSSLPVQWFWSVRRGAHPDSTVNLTTPSRDALLGDTPFGRLGESVYIGYVEKFREINVNLHMPAAGGWRSVLEYASAVDAAGKPTGWKTLTPLRDSTVGFTRSGKIEFDPPADWKTASVSGSSRLFYVRVRTTAAGIAPIASQLLNRNYAQSDGGKPPRGVIPAFDYAADLNKDGYLNDAEYAHRAAGKDARFLYESRVFYPFYGEMRFATNPASLEVQQWAADYHVRFLAQHPLADGLFMDNSAGRLPLGNTQTVESLTSYSEDYGAMLAAVSRAIHPRFIAANTSNGGPETDAVIRNAPIWMEEFAIRALAHNHQQFLDLAAMVEARQSLKTPSPYVILDSLPTGGGTRDSRTLLATLAYYYLIGDPESTFLMFFGGHAPASSWTEHWTQAAAYDIGQPIGAFSQFAEGTDPANSALTYRVYQRHYDQALVLYKPLSYRQGVGNGTLANATATTHHLGGNYRVLNALGTLGPVVTSVSLRNGEGVILVKA